MLLSVDISTPLKVFELFPVEIKTKANDLSSKYFSLYLLEDIFCLYSFGF